MIARMRFIPRFMLARMDLIRHIGRSLSPGLPLVPMRCMRAGDQASSHYRHVVFERFHRRSTDVIRRDVMENGCIRGNVTCSNDSTIRQREHLDAINVCWDKKTRYRKKATQLTVKIKHDDLHVSYNLTQPDLHST